MASRPLIAPNTVKPIINAQSTASSFNGPASVIQMLPGISYDISWTASTLGTIQIQVSNTVTFNSDGSVNNPGNWTTLPPSSFTGTYPVPAGAPGTGFIDVVGTEAYAVRLQYTATSGTGTMTVVAAAKVL